MEIFLTTIVDADPATAADRARSALLAGGWADAGGGLVFSRGTRPGTIFGLSPEWWSARATVAVLPAGAGARVDLHVAVSTIGQATTALEREYFEAAAGEAIAAAASPSVAARKCRQIAARALRQNVTAVVLIVASTTGCAVIAGRQFGTPAAYLAGAAVGLAASLPWAAWRLKVKLR